VSSDESTPATLSDVPVPDRIWDGMVALLRGTFIVTTTAVAVAGALGWPRRAAAELPAGELVFLIAQALASGAFVARSGRLLCRRYPGALAVALVAGVPVALALLMGLEWLDRREPLATWGSLLKGSVQLAALEAAPAGYLLWLLAQGRPEAGGPAVVTADSGGS
jgi:hypothetical protein